MATAAPPDLISDQSDAVLGTIVSLLPTKDGCRTQALARRWRTIWRSAPLNLDISDDGSGRLPQKTISHILSSHLGPVRRISVGSHDTISKGGLSSRDVLTGVQELDLDLMYSHVLPSSARPTLHVATFARFGVPANLAADFPRLARLKLFGITLTEDNLSAVLSGCPMLRSLSLEETAGSDRLRVSSPTLRTFSFRSPSDEQLGSFSSAVKVQELIVDDAPCLESFLLLYPQYGPATVRVVRAPKLHSLGYLSIVTPQLHLGTTVFQNMIATSLTTTMPSVKILVLDQLGPDLDSVLDALKCFPCVERLYVWMDSYVNWPQPAKNKKNPRKYALPGDPNECLEFHLKKVVLKPYYGNGTEVDFVRFFVLNAKVLERIEFGLSSDYGVQWRGNQIIELQLEDKASRDVRFEFKSFSPSKCKNIKKGKSYVDPFEASFLDGYATFWEV
ncbi:unnamed protein product [Alopecurus aequalis]